MSNDDQYVEHFFNVLGEGESYRALSPEAEERLSATMPSAFVQLLKRNGFCSFKNQMLWLCDPKDWSAAVRAWMPDGSDAQVFARTSFGDLFVWANDRCWLILVQEAIVSEKMSDFGAFLAFGMTDRDYWDGSPLQKNTKAALKALGRLNHTSVYGWVPAPALGGSETSSKLVMAPGVEHIMMLSGLRQPTILRF